MLTFSGGKFTGEGEITVSQQLLWSGGLMTRVGRQTGTFTLLNGARGEITGDQPLLLGYDFINEGDIVAHDIRSAFGIGSRVTFTNAPGAHFDVTDASRILGVADSPGVFDNRGYFIKTGGNETWIEAPFKNQATGIIAINAGSTLRFSRLPPVRGLIALGTGTIRVDSTLELVREGVLDGPGTVQGNLANSGVVQLGGKGLITVSDCPIRGVKLLRGSETPVGLPLDTSG